MHKMKTTELHNELKPSENELKISICLLSLYLNHCNKSKLMFGRTLKKLLFFPRKNKFNLRTSVYIFYKYSTLVNMKYAAFDTVLKKIWVLRKTNLLILQFAAKPAPPTKQPKYLVKKM